MEKKKIDILKNIEKYYSINNIHYLINIII